MAIVSVFVHGSPGSFKHCKCGRCQATKTDKEAKAEYMRGYYQRNRDKLRQYSRDYYRNKKNEQMNKVGTE